MSNPQTDKKQHVVTLGLQRYPSSVPTTDSNTTDMTDPSASSSSRQDEMSTTSVAELYKPPGDHHDTLPTTTTKSTNDSLQNPNREQKNMNDALKRETEWEKSREDLMNLNRQHGLHNDMDNNDDQTQKQDDQNSSWWQDYVVVDKEHAKADPMLRMVSSELGVKKLNGERQDDATVAQAILFERALDTIEDVLVHVRRIPYDLGWTQEEEDEDAALEDFTQQATSTTTSSSTSKSSVSDASLLLPSSRLKKKRPTVVVLGSGWAAHALMKVADCHQIRLIVISPTNHFVFTPMLASASVGTVEYRSMTEAVRAANPMIHSYIEGSATDVDVEKKTVTVKLNSLLESVREGDPPTLVIPYDTLVVSVGVRVSDFNVPGAATRTFKLKSCDDARRLRTAVGECFEYASRPDVMNKDDPASVEEQSRRVTFLIVGGGPTGVELAGELSDLAQDITRERVGAYPKLNKAVKVILVQSLGELLPPFEPDLRLAALKALQNRGVDVKLNTRVTEVGDGFVRLSAAVLDENGKPTSERYEYTQSVGLVAWCAGTGPVPFITQLLSKLPETARGIGGRVNVDRWMRPPMPDPKLLGSVLVMGDAAAFQEARQQSFLPQTAQVAGQQGAYAARLLNRGYDLTVTPPILLPPKKLKNADINTTATADSDNDDDAAMRTWLAFRQLETAPGFNFLNLGILAYVGGGEALSQVQIGDVPIFSYAGSVAFILWRSVYLVKQVATRNRILVTFDWFKSALFGRDVTRL